MNFTFLKSIIFFTVFQIFAFNTWAATDIPSFKETRDASSVNPIKAFRFFNNKSYMVSAVNSYDQKKNVLTLAGNQLGTEDTPIYGHNTELRGPYEYGWTLVSKSLCEYNNGKLSIKREFQCSKIYSETNRVEAAPFGLCKTQVPAENVACFPRSEGVYWVNVSTKTCSNSCGQGTVSREFKCIKVLSDGSYTDESEATCVESIGGKPEQTVSCTGTSTCSGKWIYGEWSQCLGQCEGDGVKTRSATCVDSNNNVIDDSLCGGRTDSLYTSETCSPQCYSTCKDIYDAQASTGDGNYILKTTLGNASFYCDMTNGGWTKIPDLNSLSYFEKPTELKGYSETQAKRLFLLVSNGLSNYVNGSVFHGYYSCNCGSFNVPVNTDLSPAAVLMKNNGLGNVFSVYIYGYRTANQNDRGAFSMTSYNLSGASNMSKSIGWTNFALSPGVSTYSYQLPGDTSRVYVVRQGSRGAGTWLDSLMAFRIYLNPDLPTTNFYIK